MTLTIGTWIIPLLLTVVAWVIPFNKAFKVPNTGFMGNSLECLAALVVSVIATLAIWLVWALLKLGGYV